MSKRQNKRTIIAVVVILAVAFIGLIAIDVDDASADRTMTIPPQTVDANIDAGSQSSFDMSTPMASILKMLSALVIVIICVYVGVYFLKRMMTAKSSRGGKAELLEVVQSAYVGPKKTVSLVRVGERSVLVGVTDTQISALAELDADETAAMLAVEPEAESHESFGKLISTAASRVMPFGIKKAPVGQEG